MSEIAGEWSGRYWSKATGRRGTIIFRVPEHADTGFGEVEITFSLALEVAGDASPDGEMGTISGHRITGTFSSRRESSDRRILTGQWQVERQQS